MYTQYSKYLILIVIISSSCQSALELGIEDYPNKLFVESFFNSDSLFNVKLSHSKSILDEKSYEKIESASVLIFENQILVETLMFDEFNPLNGLSIYKGKGIYPKKGDKYQIKVEANGYTSIYSTEVAIPLGVPISKFTIDTSKVIKIDFGLYNIASIEFNDPAVSENYYQIKTYQDATIRITRPSFSNPNIDTTYIEEYFREVFIEPFNSGYYDGDVNSSTDIYFSDRKFKGQPHIYEFLIPAINLDDPGYVFQDLKMIVELRNINKEMFLYETTKILQNETVGNPLAEPVFVFSNIQNGLGIFAAYKSETAFQSFVE